MGPTALIHPFPVEGLCVIDLGMFLGTAVLVLPITVRGWVLNRLEGFFLAAAYALYVTSLVA